MIVAWDDTLERFSQEQKEAASKMSEAEIKALISRIGDNSGTVPQEVLEEFFKE